MKFRLIFPKTLVSSNVLYDLQSHPPITEPSQGGFQMQTHNDNSNNNNTFYYCISIIVTVIIKLIIIITSAEMMEGRANLFVFTVLSLEIIAAVKGFSHL